MAYIGDSLTSLFGGVAVEATHKAARKMAERGTSRLRSVAREKTPKRTSHLADGWVELPVVEGHFAVWPAFIGGTINNVEYAPYVEYGTGIYGPKHAPYVIEPKTPGGVLHWIDPHTGKSVFARRVLHPGSKGAHMLSKAAAIVDGEMAAGVLMQSILEEWASAIEEAAS